MITVTMKPSATNTMKDGSIHSGASSLGKKIHASSISSHDTTAYVSATLSTWRRFSSEKKEGLSLMTLWVDRVWRASSCIGDQRASCVTTDLLKDPACRCRDYKECSPAASHEP